jgi:fructose-bisphosphate aldolase class II
VHLDHAESEELVKEALDLGYDSIMFDGSKLSYADNVAASARMAALCKSYGATLEVEIGEVGGKDGVHAPGVRTNPLEAKAFAEATGADLLAVAVGSSHAMTTRDATLDFALIQEIAKTVSVPLVLHGSSGVSDSDLQKAVKAGMSKINIATHLNNVFTHEIRQALDSNPKLVDPRKYIAPGRDAVATEVARLLILLSLTS